MAVTTQTNGGDWRDWSRWVRQGIEELRGDMKGLQNDINGIKVEVAVLKVKIALWGFVGAAIGTGLLNLLFHFLARR